MLGGACSSEAGFAVERLGESVAGSEAEEADGWFEVAESCFRGDLKGLRRVCSLRRRRFWKGVDILAGVAGGRAGQCCQGAA